MDGEEAQAQAMDGGMEEAMEAAAAMEGEMDAGMEGEPGDGMEGMDEMDADASPDQAEPEAAVVDTKAHHADDERMKAMIRWIAECLENFKEGEHWTEDHYNWLNDFLSDPEAKVLFFWNDFDDMSLRVSTVHPPKFYD
jgi:hypothetical protein